jgi:uncharacterized repeat protein (TIGR01451 family)
MIYRPSSGPSSVVRLLVGFGAAGAVSLLVLLVIGTQQAGWAQQPSGASSSPSSPQVYCGPWEVEGGQGEGTWVYWNVRWCYSPEVSGGWYRDYAGYSRTDPNVTQSITPSADAVAVGEPVTFHITETNNAPYALASLRVSFTLPHPAEFVSATPSQGGTCTNHVYQGTIVLCDLGRLPAGATAVLDVVLIPRERGTNEAFVTDYAESSGSEDDLGTPLHTDQARTSIQVYSR